MTPKRQKLVPHIGGREDTTVHLQAEQVPTRPTTPIIGIVRGSVDVRKIEFSRQARHRGLPP